MKADEKNNKKDVDDQAPSEISVKNAKIIKLLSIISEKDNEISGLKRSNALSFNVGYLIVHAFKPWYNFFLLPIKIYKVYRKFNKLSVVPKLQTKKVIDNKKKIDFSSFPFSQEGEIKLKNVKVACILDPFSFNCFLPECNLLQISKSNWKNELVGFRPDMLFIESAWRGVDNSWHNLISKNTKELKNIIAWCNNNNIPTVFWNKEDPVHFKTFAKTANQFDFVFTTDIECINKYKDSFDNDNIFLLPFAAQPKIHNPIEKYNRINGFCFAGSYYPRYIERKKDLANFVSYLSQLKTFTIFDRNYYDNLPEHKFPDEYSDFINGGLSPDNIDIAYKGYDFGINLNSVKQSRTMFARRVFELLASNTLTISNFSKGVRLFFGKIVISSDNMNEVISNLDDYTEIAKKKIKLQGLRKVLSEHTYHDRLSFICSKINNSKIAINSPSIGMVLKSNDVEKIKNSIAQFDSQLYTNKKLYIITDTKNVYGDLITVFPQSISFNSLINNINDNWVGCLFVDDWYGVNYLTDLLLSSKYSNASVIGKSVYYEMDNENITLMHPERPYSIVNKISIRSSIIKKKVLKRMDNITLSNLSGLTEYIMPKILSIDEFNYCRNATQPTGKNLSIVSDIDIKNGFSLKQINNLNEDSKESYIIGDSEILLITNQYPSYDNLYRNGFVHSRVYEYVKNNISVDVFKLQKCEGVSYDEFKGVDITIGNKEILRNVIWNSKYKTILVHFLDTEMWDILKDINKEINIIVWVHGAEIQPWHRREFNYKNDEERKNAMTLSAKRMDFWKDLIKNHISNINFVFVSKYFAEESAYDIGQTIPMNRLHIIHNPISTTVFNYIKKPAEQRKKILSIRPYASAKYANDLSVKAILELSKRPWFNELEILFIGDGVLFDETIRPLACFKNITVKKGFISQSEIATLHKDYGVFLTPTRMDSQGVSRDEAMSSGLVPVTNAVTAIPEFVDSSCGILAEGEDWEGLASGIEKLYNNPDLFMKMSKAASDRVESQSSITQTIPKELKLILKNDLQ